MLLAVLAASTADPLQAAVDDVRKIIADLGRRYQRAVRDNDAVTMAAILANDFVLVPGRGRTFTRGDLLESTRGSVVYERQDESSQTVRVWGDTAIVTALLWLKDKGGDKPFDYKLWYGDTCMRMPGGWRYVFGQASLPLPDGP